VRRLSAALAVVVAIAVLAGFAPPAPAAPVTYVAPVSAPVIDPFRPPSTPYGAGNRGLQYGTAVGQDVRASAAGRVTFAGQVGGALHVVIQHADGVRTSYSFLRTIAVRVGQTLHQSDTVGTTSDTPFHFGARIGDAYVDPAILIAAGPARVHLIPDGEFEEKGAHRDLTALARMVLDRAGSIAQQAYDWIAARGDDLAVDAGAVASALDQLGHHALDLARDAGGAAAAALRRLGSELSAFAEGIRDGTFDLMQLTLRAADEATRATASHLVGLLDQIVNMGEWAGPFAALAAAFADILQAWTEPCTPSDVEPPEMLGRQERVVVFVAGLGSQSSGRRAPENLSSELHAMGLGYAPDNIYDFSYRGGEAAYDARDTTRDLRDDARDLRALLDRISREHPGAQVDLIAHSQGGLIAREALATDYDGPGHELPSIAHVVTLATPHHGADAATAAAWLRWSAEGRAIQQLARQSFTSFDLTGPGVAQLSETSDFINRINHRALREGVAYTSIASATDLTVPAVRARLGGASNVIVDADPRWSPTGSHSSIKQSPSAVREVRLAIGDAPPTCQPVWKNATRAFAGVIVATAEDVQSAGIAAATATP
jgi:hypothetical protein